MYKNLVPIYEQKVGGEKVSVKSAERALDVIDFLSFSENGATLMDLSNHLEIPKSSMSQLLSTMLSKNYLFKSEGNLYKLGHKLIIAGNRARTTNDIYSASHTILRDTVQKTGETVFLAIRSDTEIIYLAKVDSERSARTTAQPGMRKPLHCTGLGKSFLSFEDENIRNEIFEKIVLDAHTPNTITDLDELKIRTTEYRNQGYSIDDEENDIGVYCVASPIFNDQGQMIAAISCAGSKPRMLDKKSEVIETITNAASQISISQGFDGGEQIWK